jgi:LacI family transcriptional regulator
VAELGYRRNNLGRALRANRTGTLGLVVPDLAKPFFAEIARAVEDAAFARGLRLLVGNTHFTPDRELEQIQALLDARADALLVVPADDPEPTVRMLRSAAVPHVLLHRTHADAPAVAGDDADAGAQAVRHLLQHGHTTIAVLGAGPGDDPVARRSHGALTTLAAHGIPVPPHRVRHCPLPHLRHNAYQATRSLLAEDPAVTAVCATTDEHALGALRAATEAGRRVGDDLALISIDGTELGAYLTPPLTTLAVPFAAWGTDALDHLLHPSPPPTGIRRHRLHLVTRRSCGCRP